MELSLIIPVFNAETYIRKSLEEVVSFLQSTELNFEVIVVDDGSEDQTSKVVVECRLPQVRLITQAKNLGKFSAIVTGMAEASGETRIFTDADIPFDFEALPYIHKLIAERHFHLVIGDRSVPGSHYNLEKSLLRRLTTFIFSLFVRMVVTGGLFDTQCGLKGFRGDVASKLFPLLTTNGFSGDVELLYIALKYNLEIKRIPVRLRNSAPSSVRLFSHAFVMLRNIALLKIHWLKGKYRSVGLEQIANQEYWH